MNVDQPAQSASEQHLRQAIKDQLEVIAEHMKEGAPLCVHFVRDHALIVLQLSEALRETVERASPARVGRAAS